MVEPVADVAGAAAGAPVATGAGLTSAVSEVARAAQTRPACVFNCATTAFAHLRVVGIDGAALEIR